MSSDEERTDEKLTLVREQILVALVALLPRLRIRNPTSLDDREKWALLRTRVDWLIRSESDV